MSKKAGSYVENDRDMLMYQLLKVTSYNSHVVRSPLSRILALSDLIIKGKDVKEDLEWMMPAIHKSASELDSVIRNVGVSLFEEINYLDKRMKESDNQ